LQDIRKRKGEKGEKGEKEFIMGLWGCCNRYAYNTLIFTPLNTKFPNLSWPWTALYF